MHIQKEMREEDMVRCLYECSGNHADGFCHSCPFVNCDNCVDVLLKTAGDMLFDYNDLVASIAEYCNNLLQMPDSVFSAGHDMLRIIVEHVDHMRKNLNAAREG